MTNHTPAPWEAKEIIGRSIAIFGADNKLACEVYGAEGMEKKAIANAAFIVRAVNCHEDLVQAVKDLLSRGAHGDEWRTASEKRAMQAIAKAESK